MISFDSSDAGDEAIVNTLWERYQKNDDKVWLDMLPRFLFVKYIIPKLDKLHLNSSLVRYAICWLYFLSIYILSLFSIFWIAAVENDAKFTLSSPHDTSHLFSNFSSQKVFNVLGGEKKVASCFHQAICSFLQGLGTYKFRNIIRVCFCWEIFICWWCRRWLLSWTSCWSHSGISWWGHTVKLTSHWV